MTDNRQIHDLLTDLVDAPPPVDIDVDHQIRRGRRRQRSRSAALAISALALPGIMLGGTLALRPDGPGAELPAASTQPSPSGSLRPSLYGDVRSTPKSRALLAEFERLTPEIAPIGTNAFDTQFGERRLAAGGDWRYPGTGGSTQVTVTVQVGVPTGDGGTSTPPGCIGKDGVPTCKVDNGARVPKVCVQETGPNACTDIRKLPDGSTAYLAERAVPDGVGGRAYEVRLVRADGVEVYVGNAAYRVPGAPHNAPLSLTRVLEIAQQITVRP